MMTVLEGKARAVRHAFTEGTLTLTAASAAGAASEDLDASWLGGETVIGFNGAFVREALAVFDTLDVDLTIGEPTAPALITPVDATDGIVREVILMPLRVDP